MWTCTKDKYKGGSWWLSWPKFHNFSDILTFLCVLSVITSHPLWFFSSSLFLFIHVSAILFSDPTQACLLFSICICQYSPFWDCEPHTFQILMPWRVCLCVRNCIYVWNVVSTQTRLHRYYTTGTFFLNCRKSLLTILYCKTPKV